MSELRKIAPEVWGRALLAGLLAGAAFALCMMIVNGLLGQGFSWYPNAVAAVLPAFRPAAQGFAGWATLLGLLLHLIVGMGWALVYTALVLTFAPKLVHHWGLATWLGIVFGLLLWLGFGLWFAPFFDPAVFGQVPEVFYVAHVVYGVTLVWSLAVLVPENEIAVASRARATGR